MKLETLARRGLWAAPLAIVLGLSAVPANAAEGINPDADEILRSMSKYLAAKKTLSVSADVSNEVITKQGQKLQLSSSATLLLDRPSHMRATRQGRFADAEAFYDGKTLTLYGKEVNAYVQKNVAGTTDDAFNALESGIGMALPGSDLFLSNPYAALSSGITSSGYYGTAYVGGVECHHLAFRKDQVDWQIWVKTGGEPLPMKYVITTKWLTGAPQYSVQFRNWNTEPVATAGKFTFVAPKGALALKEISVDETGEITVKQEKK